MEGWRQRRLGSKEKTLPRKRKTDLTRTGLLMEGVDEGERVARSQEMGKGDNDSFSDSGLF
jgi:hypothetical protein